MKAGAPVPRDPRRPRSEISGAHRMSQAVDLIASLRNLQVQYGNKPGFYIGHGRSLLTLPSISVPSSSGMIFRGEWTEASVANAQDVYVISAGDTAGTYVCVVNGTTNDDPPDVGNAHWVSLSDGDTIGQWL
jgi:hypothetical protein